jgi:hypothetical protein
MMRKLAHSKPALQPFANVLNGHTVSLLSIRSTVKVSAEPASNSHFANRAINLIMIPLRRLRIRVLFRAG